ncbi:MAG: cupin domain-containing protein [Bacteroidota bacterium]
MNNINNPYPYHVDTSMHNPNNMYRMCPYSYLCNQSTNYPHYPQQYIPLRDYGPEPFVVNIEEATKQNNCFRIALWTGRHLQLTLMSIGVGEDIGLEMHPDVDQFIRIEEGQGLVQMGERKDYLDYQTNVADDFVILIPAGKWHNIVNTGNKPLKLYSIYAPPQHPYGTVHQTKEDAAEAHGL